jgi:predicted porin
VLLEVGFERIKDVKHGHFANSYRFLNGENMKKKHLVAALLGALVVPSAMAQTANPVTLYGRMYVMFENVKADGGTAAPISSRNRVSNTGSSFVGVRGTEDLGGGLRAFFQWETEVRQDQNDSPFSNRNSGVGLQGGFGTIMLGRWDNPFRVVSVRYDAFNNTTIGGFNSAMGDRGNFNRLEQNVVQYWSPNFDGLSFRASYSANEGKTALVNPSTYSLSASYEKGPFSLGYGYEKHKDLIAPYLAANAAVPTTGAKETGHTLGGAVTLGAFRVQGVVQRFIKPNVIVPTLSTTVLATTPVQKAALVNLTYTAGKNQFIFQHQRAKDGRTRLVTTPTVVQPDVKVNSIGYNYLFSRRTTFISVLTQVKNNAGGLSNFASNPLAGLAPDQDPKGFAFGIRHTF